MQIRRLEQTWAIVEGRLLMADVKEDSLRCRIHPSTGEPIIGAFDEGLMPLIVSNLRSFVRAKGEAAVDSLSNRIHSLIIKDIEPIEEPTDVVTPFIWPTGFWQSKVLDDPAAEQGVYPLEDWESVVGQWPEDADFESFLATIRSSRQEPDE